MNQVISVYHAPRVVDNVKTIQFVNSVMMTLLNLHKNVFVLAKVNMKIQK